MAQFALASTTDWTIDGQHNGAETVLSRARQNSLGDHPTALEVQLKPQRPGRGRGHLSEIRGRARRQTVQAASRAGSARARNLAVAVQQPLSGHRRQQHRQREVIAQHSGRSVDAAHVDHRPRAQPQLAPRHSVIAERLLIARPAGEEIKVRLREPLAGLNLQTTQQLHRAAIVSPVSETSTTLATRRPHIATHLLLRTADRPRNPPPATTGQSPTPPTLACALHLRGRTTHATPTFISSRRR